MTFTEDGAHINFISEGDHLVPHLIEEPRSGPETIVANFPLDSDTRRSLAAVVGDTGVIIVDLGPTSTKPETLH